MTASQHTIGISPEMKREALEIVLHSDTFARADQLKSFLRYVCEMEVAGRSDEISEYNVGINALGRPKGFSATEDASVRNRAYALRHKLDTFYTAERPDARVRIEFLKGTYVPRFVAITTSARQANTETVTEQFRDLSASYPIRRAVAISLTIGCLIGAGVVGLVLRPAAPIPTLASGPSLDPIIREAWGSLLQPGLPVLISVATAAQLTMLPFDVYPEGDPPARHLEAPKELYDWYLQHHRIYPGKRLYLLPNLNSPHFGDTMAAVLAIQTLNAAGVGFQLFPERVVPSATVYSRNAILIGAPHKSEAVLKQLERGRYEFRFNPDIRDFQIIEKNADGRVKRIYTPKRDDHNDRIETFALITVLPAGAADGDRIRNISFASDPSAGAMAAVQFFSSPQHLRELKLKLLAEGARSFPRAYQVLIRSKVDGDLAVGFSYESHEILQHY